MASVQILPGIQVAIAAVNAHGYITPMISSLINETPDTIHHSLGVRDRVRFVIQILFNLHLLDASRAELIEFAVRIDSFNVAHGHVPVADICAAGGVFNLLSIPDGTTGTVKTAEFRAILTSASADGEDPHTLLRAQQVGQIQVDIRHEWGTPITDRSGSLHTLRHDGSYSSHIRDRTRATYYTHYDNPSPDDSTMITFVHDAQFGEIGHFMFLYNSEEFVARFNRQPQIGSRMASSVQSILPARMSTGHLTRGAMSIIPPDLHHGDIGISVTPHTAGVQSTAPTSTAQRSSINVGGGLFATPGESLYSRLDYHDSVASHTAGAQFTASTPTSQQPSTDTGGGSSATPSINPTTATHPYLRGSVPPTASAPYTSFPQPPGAHPASDLNASGRPSSTDWIFNNRYPAIHPRPQPADAHPNDKTSTSSANCTFALEPDQTARKAPSQAQASTDSAGAGASSSSAALETQESWGTRLRETILAEAAPFRFPLSTPATGGALPINPQAQSMTAFAPARAGMFPYLATPWTQDMTGSIRPGSFGRRPGSRPRLPTGSGQDDLPFSQSHNAAAYGRHRAPGFRPPLRAKATSGSNGASNSARPATSQAHSMAGPAGFPLLPPFQQHPATSVTAGRVPSRSATSQEQSTAASTGPGSSPDTAIVTGYQITSTPDTGGGSVPSSLVAPHAEPVTGSGSDGASGLTANSQAQSTAAPAEAGVPSIPVDPQAMSAAATDSGVVSSLSGVPQAASTIDTGFDNSDEPSRKKRKLSEK